jgi:hypothetical protein
LSRPELHALGWLVQSGNIVLGATFPISALYTGLVPRFDSSARLQRFSRI